LFFFINIFLGRGVGCDISTCDELFLFSIDLFSVDLSSASVDLSSVDLLQVKKNMDHKVFLNQQFLD